MQSKYIREVRNTIRRLKESRKIILIISSLFFFSILIGGFFPKYFHNNLESDLMNLIEGAPTDDYFSLFKFILLNNAKSSLIALILGITIIIPFLILVINGYIIGAVMNNAISENGFVAIFSLVPHGIFEIPAFLISISYGIIIGMSLFSKDKISDKYIEGLKTYLIVVLPLLLIAAIIESGLIIYFS